jgi:Ca-activated chloride channel family protein
MGLLLFPNIVPRGHAGKRTPEDETQRANGENFVTVRLTRIVVGKILAASPAAFLLLTLMLVGLVLSPFAAHSQESDSPKPPDSHHEASLLHEELPAASSIGDPWTLQKRVDEVTVFFTATDGHKFVQDLTQENIRVTDDRRPVARISAFGHQRELPLRLGLLVDTSASVNPRFRFEQQAATQFLNKMVRRGFDKAFVIGFADRSNLTQDYTDDPEQLAAGVAALRNGGGTALFDAVYDACEKLTSAKAAEAEARILIVLSDGDNNSGHITLSRAIEMAQMRDVTIYAINTRNESTDSIYLAGMAKSDAAMKELAAQTGGRSFVELSNREVTRAFSIIEDEMRNRYSVSYQPRDLEENGRFRRIDIVAERSGRRFRVHARKGYYAKLKTP